MATTRFQTPTLPQIWQSSSILAGQLAHFICDDNDDDDGDDGNEDGDLMIMMMVVMTVIMVVVMMTVMR